MIRQKYRISPILFILPAIMLLGYTTDDFFTRLKKSLAEDTKNIPVEYVYVLTDKNVYKPGEQIWFKAYFKNKNNRSFRQPH